MIGAPLDSTKNTFSNVSCLEEEAKLMEQLEVLRQKKLKAAEKKSTSSRASSASKPSGRKATGPSPAAASGKRRRPAEDEEPEVTGNDGDDEEPNTEAAKNNRLRRICEVKPSGRCHVSEEIHQRWKKGGTDRLALRDELEACGWDKDWSISQHCGMIADLDDRRIL